MSDSTNAEVPGFVTSEREIAPVIDEVIRTAEQRVIVASFASHVHRIQQVIDAAAKHGRKVALVGRSMVRNMGVARDLGYLRVPPGADRRLRGDRGAGRRRTWCWSAPARRASRWRRCRGWPTATTASVSPRATPSCSPRRWCRATRPRSNRVINGLTRWGARVVHKGNAKVHVSGHAAAGELLYVLNLTRPSNFMPVHGEWRHLRAHAKLAALTGVPDDHIVIAEDGVVVDLVDGRAKVVGAVHAGYVYVDGSSVGDDHRRRR